MSPAPDCESRVQIHMYIAVKSTSKFFFEMLSFKRHLLSLVLSSSTDAYYSKDKEGTICQKDTRGELKKLLSRLNASE